MSPGLNAETGVVGLKIEAVESVAEIIAAVDCRMLVEEPDFVLEPVMNEQNPARPYLGGVEQVPGGISCTMSFNIAAKGAGVANLDAGVGPAWGDALRCCGFAENLEAGVKADYTPNLVGSAIPSATIKLFKDGKQRTMRGARGTCSAETEGNAIKYLAFEFTGVFESETDEAPPVGIVYDPTTPPVLVCADYMLLKYHPVNVATPTAFAAEEILRSAANTNIQLAVTLASQTFATQVKAVRLRLRQLGTPAGHTNGIWATIEGDAAGDPDGAPIGTSRFINTDVFPISNAAGGEYVTLIFDTPVSLSAATVYHIVLSGDYTESAVNAVAWETATVAAPAQISQDYDLAWAALPLKNFVFDALHAALAEIIIAGVTWDLGNTVGLRPNVNDCEGFQGGWVGQRLAVGSVEPEEELDANRDFLNNLRDVDVLMQRYKMGEERGNFLEFTMPQTQVIGANEWGERESVLTRPLELQHNQAAGGDDIIIVSR
jgi:hypothetical protein